MKRDELDCLDIGPMVFLHHEMEIHDPNPTNSRHTKYNVCSERLILLFTKMTGAILQRWLV